MKRALCLIAALAVTFSAVSFSSADRPTDFYQTTTKKDNQTDAQTDKELWDPATDKRIVIQGIYVSADAAQTIFFEVTTTEVIPTIYLDADATSNDGISCGGAPILILAKDEVLTYTTSTGANTSVIVYGYEEEF